MTEKTARAAALTGQDDAQIRQLRHLLTEMEALLNILPADAPHDPPGQLPSEEEVEASFDNMPV